MWAKVESGSVTEIYTSPKRLTIGDTQYPSNIFQLWEAAELRAIGIYPIVEDNSNLKDKEFYTNTNVTYAVSDGNVIASYGTATAKSMTDVLFTAEDEAAIPSQVEGTVKTRGLKSMLKKNVNNIAAGFLSQYDWYTLRAADGGTAVPSNIATYRAAVRTKANTHCTSIDNASDVDALAALTFDWPAQP